MMRIAIVCDRTTEYATPVGECCFFTSDAPITAEDWKGFSAVFLLQPYTEKALLSWTGHPHLRCVESIGELQAEIDSMNSHIEIEKKYLIRRPDLKKLAKYHPFKAEIEQVYLVCLNGSHRIRKRVSDGVTEYVETLKIRISGTKSREYEEQIDEATYTELLKRADKEKHPIIKDRYCFVFDGQYFELDIYDFWQDRATLELELRDESQAPRLPKEIEVIKDVSEDYRYKNNHLARIPYEDYSTELL